MNKAGGNWVAGDDFFDREAELEALAERIKEGTHTLLTAQRRMGKTSLVRELLRRFKEDDKPVETVFADLEEAVSPADAIAEIASQARSVRAWDGIKQVFANVLDGSEFSARVGATEVKAKFRAGVDAGNW